MGAIESRKYSGLCRVVGFERTCQRLQSCAVGFDRGACKEVHQLRALGMPVIRFALRRVHIRCI